MLRPASSTASAKRAPHRAVLLLAQDQHDRAHQPAAPEAGAARRPPRSGAPAGTATTGSMGLADRRQITVVDGKSRQCPSAGRRGHRLALAWSSVDQERFHEPRTSPIADSPGVPTWARPAQNQPPPRRVTETARPPGCARKLQQPRQAGSAAAFRGGPPTGTIKWLHSRRTGL